MAWTQADLDKVNRAIASGVLLVEHNGRRVRYRDLDDLKATQGLIQADLAKQAGKKRVRIMRLNVDKGIV